MHSTLTEVPFESVPLKVRKKYKMLNYTLLTMMSNNSENTSESKIFVTFMVGMNIAVLKSYGRGAPVNLN